MKYLIAYDVADPRRLQRVARALEKSAVRCQKSVFLFRGDRTAVEALLDKLLCLLRPADDVIQAWPIGAGEPISRGTPLPVTPHGIVLGPSQALFVVHPVPPEDSK